VVDDLIKRIQIILDKRRPELNPLLIRKRMGDDAVPELANASMVVSPVGTLPPSGQGGQGDDAEDGLVQVDV